jgi:hypothetical protein
MAIEGVQAGGKTPQINLSYAQSKKNAKILWKQKYMDICRRNRLKN